MLVCANVTAELGLGGAFEMAILIGCAAGAWQERRIAPAFVAIRCGSNVAVAVSDTYAAEARQELFGGSMKLRGMLAVKRAAITTGAAVALCCATGAVVAPVATASPTDDAYLAAIQAAGVPILGRDYVVALGHAICETARQNPSMELVDLVLNDVSNENKPSPYSFDQGKVIATSALANYCPYGVAGGDPAAPVNLPPVDALPPAPTPYAPLVPNAPSANVPNIGCTWVNGYTKKNGTRVSGYYRC